MLKYKILLVYIVVAEIATVCYCWNNVEYHPLNVNLESTEDKMLPQSSFNFLHAVFKRSSQNRNTQYSQYNQYNQHNQYRPRSTTSRPSTGDEDKTCSSCGRCSSGKCRSNGGCC
ncbi:unnamed protein product [Orchesella dallaii]|uniref:Secreted protein n=1 Tax=Orchesella dallaii TaxID=48710 RepID=A0ABP1S9R2_9HEXA